MLISDLLFTVVDGYGETPVACVSEVRLLGCGLHDERNVVMQMFSAGEGSGLLGMMEWCGLGASRGGAHGRL